MNIIQERMVFIMWSLRTTPQGLRNFADKLRILDLIEKHEDEGYIHIIASGTDCDHVRYTARPRKIEANFYSYMKILHKEHEQAEGPFYLDIVSKEIAADAKPTTRDLIMEAYENGHPHVVSTVIYSYE